MSPDKEKIAVIKDWPIPKTVTEIRQFLGLASYYRRYIQQFADIATPLHYLTEKTATFVWTEECQKGFQRLKDLLSQAPVLCYPSLTKDFELQTDASAVGLGAVLEQDGHVVAYASRSLTHAERQYSVIERECLAVLYAVKQFRHYLLGRAFVLHTDHQPLQWLSAQKMEGRLCRWALALQEFDFTIKYRRGSSNANADALSRVPTIPSTCAGTVTVPELTLEDVAQEQGKDEVLNVLCVVDGVLCCKYTPGPLEKEKIVPIVPLSLQPTALKVNHDIISSGHQGVEKTLQRLKRTAYWIGMAKDTELYCRSCMVCQRSKLPMPTPVPMTNIPIGHPWQMLAVDVLQVPVSSRGNRYLLVIQDYFTKWAEAIPMPNQTAECIAGILIDLFSRFGIPEILHSDHGANFESTMIRRVCAAFGVLKSREQQHTTRKNDIDWEGNLPLVLYAYRTASNASTGFSPFVLMMGRDPVLPSLPSMTNSSAEDPTSYDSNLRVKMAKLRAMVESHIVQEAKRQKDHYDTRTQRKLDPKWEGGWVVKKVHSPVTLQIEHRKSLRSRVVHINRIRRCILREKESTLSREVEWEPASIEYFSVPADSTPEPEIVPEVPPAVLPPIDLEGQEAPPTLYQAQRRYPQLEGLETSQKLQRCVTKGDMVPRHLQALLPASIKHQNTQPREQRSQPVHPDPQPIEPAHHHTDQLPPRNPKAVRRPRPRHGETRNHTTLGRPHTITANYKHTKCPPLLRNMDHFEGSQESLGSSQDSLGSVQDSPHHTPRILLTTPGNTEYDCEGRVAAIGLSKIDQEEAHSISMPTLFTKDKKPTHPHPLLMKRPKKCTGRVKLPPLSIPGNNSIPTVQRQRSFSDPDIKLPRLTHL
ncbi:hypothetical protein EMCRGX_G034481 [Ephydatia muelleri]